MKFSCHKPSVLQAKNEPLSIELSLKINPATSGYLDFVKSIFHSAEMNVEELDDELIALLLTQTAFTAILVNEIMNDAIENEDQIANRKELDLINLALSLKEYHSEILPGRGRRMFDAPRRDPSILGFNYSLVDYVLGQPGKCIGIIGLTSKEFYHMLPFIEAEVNLHETQMQLGHRKANITQRFFMLLVSISTYMNLRVMEVVFNVARASIHSDLLCFGRYVLDVIVRQSGNCWPRRHERDYLRTFLPEALRDSGIFFLVDPTKQKNVDSIHRDTRELHFNSHKGFGPNHCFVVDILGRIIYLKVGSPGSSGDLSIYRQTDLYLQQNGYNFDDDETGGGDSKLRGAANIRPTSMSLARAFTQQEIFEQPEDLIEFALIYNDAYKRMETVVEQAIGGVKRDAFASDRSKSRISMHSNSERVSLFFELNARLLMCKMRWRGQIFRSNPAVLSHGNNGVHLPTKIINEYLNNLYTAEGRKNAFFGQALAGLDQDEPDILNGWS